MTRIIDVDGTPFKHDEWVRYSMAKTTAGILAVHVVMLAAVSLYYANQVPDTLLHALAYMTAFTAIYYVLIRKAWDHWDHAESIRRWAEARAESVPIFATILAGVVIKALQKIADQGGKSQDSDCIEVAEVREGDGQ